MGFVRGRHTFRRADLIIPISTHQKRQHLQKSELDTCDFHARISPLFESFDGGRAAKFIKVAVFFSDGQMNRKVLTGVTEGEGLLPFR